MKPRMEKYHSVGLRLGGQSWGCSTGHEAATGLLRHVLSELQAEAREVFCRSGDTVDRFLRERRDELANELGAAA